MATGSGYLLPPSRRSATIREQRFGMRRKSPPRGSDAFRSCATCAPRRRSGRGLFELLFHALEQARQLSESRSEPRRAGSNTSLELFRIVQKECESPICRLLSNAASVVGPAKMTLHSRCTCSTSPSRWITRKSSRNFSSSSTCSRSRRRRFRARFTCR